MVTRALVILVVCLGLLLSLKLAGVFDTPVVEKPVIGAAAPDFTLGCVDGSTVTLSKLRGSKVIICFWHNHSNGDCPHNELLLSGLQQVHEKRPDLPILAIRSDYANFSAINIYSYLSENKFTFTVPVNTKDTVSKLYNVSAYPVTFFLDSNGIIRKVKIGPLADANEIDQILNSY